MLSRHYGDASPPASRVRQHAGSPENVIALIRFCRRPASLNDHGQPSGCDGHNIVSNRDRLPSQAPTFSIQEGDAARDMVPVLQACLLMFPDFRVDYLAQRLPMVTDPALVAARDGDEIIAFKLGYRRGAGLFYSWLGGVVPSARRRGVASRLTRMQHEWALSKGYQWIETRTRATNNPMIILNLQQGFEVCGFETNPHGIAVITQRKKLSPGPEQIHEDH